MSRIFLHKNRYADIRTLLARPNLITKRTQDSEFATF